MTSNQIVSRYAMNSDDFLSNKAIPNKERVAKIQSRLMLKKSQFGKATSMEKKRDTLTLSASLHNISSQ